MEYTYNVARNAFPNENSGEVGRRISNPTQRKTNFKPQLNRVARTNATLLKKVDQRAESILGDNT